MPKDGARILYSKNIHVQVSQFVKTYSLKNTTLNFGNCFSRIHLMTIQQFSRTTWICIIDITTQHKQRVWLRMFWPV